jgi:hypothetical protein
VEPVGDGFATSYVKEDIFKHVNVLRCEVKQIQQMDQVKQERQLLLYTSKSNAIMALLIHLLMNIQTKMGTSWLSSILV